MRCEDGIHYFFSQKGHCVCGERTNEAYKQGRKDAIDEVLGFLRSKDGREYGYGTCPDIADWLEGKLKPIQK